MQTLVSFAEYKASFTAPVKLAFKPAGIFLLYSGAENMKHSFSEGKESNEPWKSRENIFLTDKINEILAEGFDGPSRHLTRHKDGGVEMCHCGISATLSI